MLINSTPRFVLTRRSYGFTVARREMSFHPLQHLPGCMMPDGGDCCASYSDLCDDWHKQRRRIEALEAALRFYACDGHWMLNGQCDPNSSRFEGPNVARAALDKDEGK